MFVNLNKPNGNPISLTRDPRVIKALKDIQKQDPAWFRRACYILSHFKPE
jgi:hypothetical protein